MLSEVSPPGTDPQPPQGAHEIAQVYEDALDNASTLASPQGPPATAPVAPPPPSPPRRPVDGIRIHLKVWTDPQTRARYLVPVLKLPDPRHPLEPIYAYALRGEELRHVPMTMQEWNALPYAYFQEER